MVQVLVLFSDDDGPSCFWRCFEFVVLGAAAGRRGRREEEAGRQAQRTAWIGGKENVPRPWRVAMALPVRLWWGRGL